jgi:antagonist of KipI
MTAGLTVHRPGPCSLLVDLGRPASRSLGVPIGGAADRVSLALGNALVGNPPHAVALEISLAGPILEADGEIAAVVYGAPFRLESDRQRLRPGVTFTLQPGEVLSVGAAANGMRAYLCVRGGFAVPEVLGSRSALQPVQANDRLACLPGRIGRRFIRPTTREADGPTVLRVVPGPQASWFREAEFYGQCFAVGPASNRMGLRLTARPLTTPGRELVSEPVAPGAVQVVADGQCIILGIDGQTIGGYPKIAHVIAADLHRLGQLRPGDVVRFHRVRLDAAADLWHQQQAELHAWQVRLAATLDSCDRPVGPARRAACPSAGGTYLP